MTLTLVFSPRVSAFRSRTDSEWQMQRLLRAQRAQLAVAFATHDTVVHQGRVAVTIPAGTLELQLERAELLIAALDGEWDLGLSPSDVKLSRYFRAWLALQAARLGSMVASPDALPNALAAWREAGDAAAVTRSLYAVPFDRAQSDELARWARDEQIWPSSGWAVRSDIHGTEAVLAPEIAPIADRFVSGKMSLAAVLREAFAVRERHSLRIRSHLRSLTNSAHAFAATGDGLIGFAHAPFRGGASFGLTSGVSAVRVSWGRPEQVMRRLDFGMHVTKVFKKTSSPLRTLVTEELILDRLSRETVESRLGRDPDLHRVAVEFGEEWALAGVDVLAIGR